MITGFDDVYRKTSYYGDHASPALVQYLKKYSIATHGEALDLGCGQGRNALYLAELGFNVLGLDNSSEAIAHLKTTASEKKLQVTGQVVDLAKLEITPARYQLIVANTSLDHLTADEGGMISQAITNGLAPGGHLFVSVFMVNDPGNNQQGLRASETASYVQHYYEPNELRKQFPELTLLAYQEEFALDVGHGQPHYHAIARLFAQRQI
jgi:tellurite methyltransferase